MDGYSATSTLTVVIFGPIFSRSGGEDLFRFPIKLLGQFFVMKLYQKWSRNLQIIKNCPLCEILVVADPTLCGLFKVGLAKYRYEVSVGSLIHACIKFWRISIFLPQKSHWGYWLISFLFTLHWLSTNLQPNITPTRIFFSRYLQHRYSIFTKISQRNQNRNVHHIKQQKLKHFLQIMPREVPQNATISHRNTNLATNFPARIRTRRNAYVTLS